MSIWHVIVIPFIIQVKGDKGSAPSVAYGIMRSVCKSHKKRYYCRGEMNWKDCLIYPLSEAGMKKFTQVGNWQVLVTGLQQWGSGWEQEKHQITGGKRWAVDGLMKYLERHGLVMLAINVVVPFSPDVNYIDWAQCYQTLIKLVILLSMWCP